VLLVIALAASATAIAVFAPAAGGERAPRLLEVKRPASGPPSGVALLIHGGGWWSFERLGLRNRVEGPIARALLRRGVAVASVDYRSGARSIADVLTAVERLRMRFRRSLPLCAVGGSAGGHLALISEAFGADYDCIVADAPPVDLRDTSTSNPGLVWLGELIKSYWPRPAERRRVSPTVQAARGRIDTPTWIGASSCDFLIPVADLRDYRAAVRAAGVSHPARLVVLDPVEEMSERKHYFGHCLQPVKPQPLRDYERRRLRMLLRHLG
jgi:acetyl esterase/lipase